MSRSKIGVAFEGMVPAQKGEVAAKAADSTKDLSAVVKVLNEGMIKVINQMDSMLLAPEQRYSSGLAGVQEEAPSTQRHCVSKDGVIRNTPPMAELVRCSQSQLRSSRAQVITRSRIKYQLLDLAIIASNPGVESIRGGVIHDTAPLKPFETKTSNLVQIQRIGQPETNLAPVSRPIGSDINRGFCPDESTLREPPRGESLNEEPVLQSTYFEDGENSVKQEEATPTSPSMQKGRSISSQVVAVCATRSKKYGMVRHQPLLRNQTAINTAEENKSFDPGGKQVIAPCFQDLFLYQEGHERATRAVLWWFAVLAVFSCGTFL